MAKNKPPEKRKDQGQFVARRTGPVSLPKTDPNYPPQAFKMAVYEQQSMSGPLPSSRELVSYNEVIPNGAERIMAMAEREQMARLEENRTAQALDRRALKGFNFRGAFSQVAAFVLTALGFVTATYLGLHGQVELAKVIFGTTIGSVVFAFLVAQGTKAYTNSHQQSEHPTELSSTESGAEEL